MKKRILLTLGASMLVGASFAQAPIKSAPQSINHKLMNGMPSKPSSLVNGNKEVTDRYYFDFIEAEADLGSNFDGWFAGSLQDHRDTTSIFGNSRGYYSVVSKYSDMVIFNNSDGSILYGDFANVSELKLDSIYFVLGFVKQTAASIKDSLKISIYDVDANDHPVISGTPIAEEIIEFTETFPAGNTGLSGGYFGVDFNGIVIPNKKFSVRFEYIGDTADSMYIGYQFPSDGTPCVVDGNPAGFEAPIEGNYYPQSYYVSPYGKDTIDVGGVDSIIFNQQTVLVPRDPASTRPGQFIWYSLCNGISPSIGGVTYANNPAANGFQYLMVIPIVTLTHNISVQDMEAKSVIVNNFPNPAVENTTIEYTVPAEGNVTLMVTDLTGKQLVNQNLGKVAGGKNSYVLNTSEFNAGVYIYTVNYNGTQVTRKFVVSK